MQKTRMVLLLAALAAVVLMPAQALAQGRASNSYLAGFSVGIGGASDSEPDSGFDNTSFQGLFSVRIDNTSLWGVRLGQIDMDFEGGGGGELLYLTVAGEYLYQGNFYESGLFIGLGAYDLSVDGAEDGTALGINLGVTGYFPVTENWSIVTELSGHYADLDEMQFFGMVHVGAAWRF